jgi:hypothetical protein
MGSGPRGFFFFFFLHQLIFPSLAPPILTTFSQYTISSCHHPLTRATLHRFLAGIIPLIEMTVDRPQSVAHPTLDLVNIHSTKAIASLLPHWVPLQPASDLKNPSVSYHDTEGAETLELEGPYCVVLLL